MGNRTRRQRTAPIRKGGRFPSDMQQKQPTGSGFIKRFTFDVVERTSENMLTMCTDLTLNWREKAVQNQTGSQVEAHQPSC